MLKIAVFYEKDSKNDFKNETQKQNTKTESTESILEKRNKHCFLDTTNSRNSGKQEI